MTDWGMTCEDCGGSFSSAEESEYEELLRCDCGSQYAVAITKLATTEDR